jgi:hypothetical protein
LILETSAVEYLTKLVPDTVLEKFTDENCEESQQSQHSPERLKQN